jgi:hypothetical protein
MFSQRGNFSYEAVCSRSSGDVLRICCLFLQSAELTTRWTLPCIYPLGLELRLNSSGAHAPYRISFQWTKIHFHEGALSVLQKRFIYVRSTIWVTYKLLFVNWHAPST